MSTANKNNYGMGYTDSFIAMLKLRTVATHAQFLLPFLKPGIKILDCGCGPGSMTIDLARHVPNGEVIGIDIEESQLEIACNDAKNSGVTNVTFQNANVFELPFADNTFDIVFSHGLLNHFQDPLPILIEKKRVVKSGGIVAARNGHHDGSTYYPNTPTLIKASHLFIEPMVAGGGDKNIAIKLGELFCQAGFCNIKHTMFCDTSNAKERAILAANGIMTREYNKKLLESGAITLEQLEDYKKAWLDFANHPHAFSYFPWGEAIGEKQYLE